MQGWILSHHRHELGFDPQTRCRLRQDDVPILVSIVMPRQLLSGHLVSARRQLLKMMSLQSRVERIWRPDRRGVLGMASLYQPKQIGRVLHIGT